MIISLSLNTSGYMYIFADTFYALKTKEIVIADVHLLSYYVFNISI